MNRVNAAPLALRFSGCVEINWSVLNNPIRSLNPTFPDWLPAHKQKCALFRKLLNRRPDAGQQNWQPPAEGPWDISPRSFRFRSLGNWRRLDKRRECTFNRSAILGLDQDAMVYGTFEAGGTE